MCAISCIAYWKIMPERRVYEVWWEREKSQAAQKEAQHFTNPKKQVGLSQRSRDKSARTLQEQLRFGLQRQNWCCLSVKHTDGVFVVTLRCPLVLWVLFWKSGAFGWLSCKCQPKCHAAIMRQCVIFAMHRCLRNHFFLLVRQGNSCGWSRYVQIS